MTTGRLRFAASSPTRSRFIVAVMLTALVGSVSACRFVSTDQRIGGATVEQEVAKVAGWTRIATTERYLVVANVLPGERMFTSAQAAAENPTEGELIIRGPGNPIGAHVRHVEAHVYDRTTGLPLSNVTTAILLLNRTTGERVAVEPTLMQDVNIGALDIHYGNNVIVTGSSDVRLTITINGQEVTLDGHLD